MATLKEISKGKKFYHVTASVRRSKFTCRRVKIAATIYVLAVDTEGKRVLASINGLPANWVERHIYQRWKKTNPLEKTKQVTNDLPKAYQTKAS